MAEIKIIEILKLSDEKLMKISKDAVLSLDLAEMKTVQAYFKKLKRNPTDVELETLAQTWSEHCKHKTLAGVVEYSETKESFPSITEKGKTRIYIIF